MFYKIITFQLIAILSFSVYASSKEQEFKSGFDLYNQNNWIDSQKHLKIAAEAGNSDAQYYLAEALRLSNRYMTMPPTRPIPYDTTKATFFPYLS